MAFSDELTQMCADIDAQLSDGTITITNATGGGSQTVNALRQPREAFDSGGAGIDKCEWIVLKANLSTLPLAGYKVTDSASGTAVQFIIERDGVGLECAGRQVRIKGTRMKAMGA